MERLNSNCESTVKVFAKALNGQKVGVRLATYSVIRNIEDTPYTLQQESCQDNYD